MTTPDRAAAPAPLAERLRELMAKATPGPWEHDTNGSPGKYIRTVPYGEHDGYDLIGRFDYAGRAPHDAELVLTLVNNLPTLLAALDGREAGWRDGIEASIRYLRNAAEIYGVETAKGLALGLKHMVECGDLKAAPPARPQLAGEAGDE